jgi:hypothetical protein
MCLNIDFNQAGDKEQGHPGAGSLDYVAFETATLMMMINRPFGDASRIVSV